MPSFKLSPLANSIKNAFWSWNNPANPNLLNNYTPAERASGGIPIIDHASLLTMGDESEYAASECIDRCGSDEPCDAKRCPLPEAMDKAAAGTSAALRDGTIGTLDGEVIGDASNIKISSTLRDYDPEALCAAMTTPPDLGESLICTNRECLHVFIRGPEVCPYCGARAPKQAKRIRSRHKPLTVADIVANGEGAAYVPKKGNNKSPNIIVRALGCGPQGSNEWSVVWSRENETPHDYDTPNCDPIDVFLSIVARRVEG